MTAPSMEELSTAYACARADLDRWIAEADADRDIDPDTAVVALRVELLARGYGVAYLSALAAWAIGRIAESRRPLSGQRHWTRDDRDACANEAAAKRREGV